MKVKRVWLPAVVLAVCLPVHASTKSQAAGQPPGVYISMLKDYTRYAESLWHASPDHPGMGYWGTGRGDWNNEGIRAVSNTALVYAFLKRSGATGIEVADRIEPALRWCAATHVTGNAHCTDGKPWGRGWQTAMWAANTGMAAWLVQKELDPQVYRSVCRVVADEADRFNEMTPPDSLPGDTKAEENAWNLTAPAAALLLMPGHAHATRWRDTVLRWGFNTLSCEADRTSAEILDGRPVSEWVSTAQVYPDYSLENHGFFHPVYAMVAPATNGQAAVMFKLAGRPVPDALKHNVLNGWEMLQHIMPPDGEWLYPQGLDWDLHDYEHIGYLAMLSTLYQRPEAAVLEERLAGYARRRQVLNGNGAFVGPTGSLGFAREAVQAERIAFAALMHEVFGPPPRSSSAPFRQMADKLRAPRAFEKAGFVVYRTQRGLTSFSWKKPVMGLVLPDSERNLKQPYVTTPWPGSLTGRFTLEGQTSAQASTISVQSHEVRTTDDRYTVGVDALVNDGVLRQSIVVSSMEPGIVACIDQVTALKDATVLEERGLPVAVENDEMSGNRRVLTTSTGSITVSGGANKEYPLGGNWVNVDGRLGMAVPGSAMLYRAAGTSNRAGAREDILFGAYNGTKRAFGAGDTLSERAVILLMNASIAETQALAKSATLTRTNGHLTLAFTAPDGIPCTLTLKGG